MSWLAFASPLLGTRGVHHRPRPELIHDRPSSLETARWLAAARPPDGRAGRP